MTTPTNLVETTQCLCLASRRAARAITREFDRALRGHGLRSTQFTLLAALHLAGSRSIGNLADLLGVDRTTLTRNLAVVEQHGWVTTRVDRADTRSRLATITPKGRRQLVAALPDWRRTQHALTETIGPQATVSLRKLAGGPCTMLDDADARRHFTTKRRKRKKDDFATAAVAD
ncbi:MAG: MarR family winged helix-turn-helix transcriptional regulator [Lysobacterales bacterium]